MTDEVTELLHRSELPAAGFGVADVAERVARRRTRRRRRVGLVGAITTALVVVVALAAWPDHSSQQEVTVGPPSTASNPPLSTTGPVPAIPAGWRVLDVGEVRFAVPADWAVPLGPTCWSPSEGAGGAVLITPAEGSCGGSSLPPPDRIHIALINLPAEKGPQVEIGSLTATRLGLTCESCLSYRLDNGYRIDVHTTNAQADAILATFQPSGSLQALDSHPAVDTSAWQTVRYQGVTFDAPPDWPTIDLPASVQHRNDGVGGRLDPGTCWPPFTNGDANTVFLGLSGLTPSCPPPDEPPVVDLGDGVWIASRPDPDLTATASWTLGPGVTAYVDESRQSLPSAAIEVDVKQPARTLHLLVGTANPAIAWGILRSIRTS